VAKTSSNQSQVEVIGLSISGEISPGTDLAKLLVEFAEENNIGIRDGDVIVVTSKAVLKSMGMLFKIDDVKPSFAAKLISKITGKDPREVELILRASNKIIAVVPMKNIKKGLLGKITRNPDDARLLLEKIPSLLVVTTKQGLIALDGGVDYSNLPPGYAIANIVDFDQEARRIREEIMRLTGRKVAVVVSDTETNTSGKLGTIDIAVGSAGIKPVTPYFASKDRYGKPKFGGMDIVVDEIASAAALLMGQTSEGIPAVIIRGLKYEESGEGVNQYGLDVSGLSLSIILKTILVRLVHRLFYRGGNHD